LWVESMKDSVQVRVFGFVLFAISLGLLWEVSSFLVPSTSGELLFFNSVGCLCLGMAFGMFFATRFVDRLERRMSQFLSTPYSNTERFCPSCQTLNKSDAVFCNKCGKKL
jgi:uncharacterized paraquat-inducible protein A